MRVKFDKKVISLDFKFMYYLLWKIFFKKFMYFVKKILWFFIMKYEMVVYFEILRKICYVIFFNKMYDLI